MFELERVRRDDDLHVADGVDRDPRRGRRAEADLQQLAVSPPAGRPPGGRRARRPSRRGSTPRPRRAYGRRCRARPASCTRLRRSAPSAAEHGGAAPGLATSATYGHLGGAPRPRGSPPRRGRARRPRRASASAAIAVRAARRGAPRSPRAAPTATSARAIGRVPETWTSGGGMHGLQEDLERAAGQARVVHDDQARRAPARRCAAGSGVIRSSVDAPVASSRSPCSRTVDSAQVPPTNPSSVPSGSTSARSPGFATGRPLRADHRREDERAAPRAQARPPAQSTAVGAHCDRQVGAGSGGPGSRATPPPA